MQEYISQCWNCLGEYDALSAVWCSCSPVSPSKVCPFCLQCFCSADADFMEKFWKFAPEELKEERDLLSNSRGPLGEALIGAKAITNDQLVAALKRQKESGKRLGECLVELGHVSEETLDYFLKQQRTVTQLSLSDAKIPIKLVKKIGFKECRSRQIIPVDQEDIGHNEMFILGMVNPSDGETIDLVHNLFGGQIVPMRVDAAELAVALDEVATKLAPEAAGASRKNEEQGPIDDLLLKLIGKAISSGASDVQLEPKETETTLHYRIDGVLYKIKPLSSEAGPELIRNIKKLLKLPLEGTPRPMDGRTLLTHKDRKVQINGSILPTIHGESVTLKLIDIESFFKPMESLGMDRYVEGVLNRVLEMDRGMVILSGPIFNGTTTTFYSILQELAKRGGRKIMTLECPVTAQMDNVVQTEISNPDDEETLSSGLRGLMKSNAQVVGISEIFSPSALDQMVRMSHKALVITTMESPRAATALRELSSMAHDREGLSNSLRLILVQKLLRKVCPDCSEQLDTSDRFLSMFGLAKEEMEGLQSYQGTGCSTCNKIGYKGRVATFEAVPITSTIRELIEKNSSAHEILETAKNEGMVPMRAKVLKLIAQGETTLDEFQKANL